MMKKYEGKVVLYDEPPPDSLYAQCPPENRYVQDWPDNWEKPFPEKFVRLDILVNSVVSNFQRIYSIYRHSNLTSLRGGGGVDLYKLV